MTTIAELEDMLKTIDDGRYWLESTPTRMGVELVVRPSVDGEPMPGVVLARLAVYPAELGLAPGQTWPLKLNVGRRLIALPFPGDDYEEKLGEALALRVLHVLTLAYRSEYSGMAPDATLWRDPNPGIIHAWEAANDRAAILNEKRKMLREGL